MSLLPDINAVKSGVKSIFPNVFLSQARHNRFLDFVFTGEGLWKPPFSRDGCVFHENFWDGGLNNFHRTTREILRPGSKFYANRGLSVCTSPRARPKMKGIITSRERLSMGEISETKEFCSAEFNLEMMNVRC
jgi:hypothetical protein